MRSPRRRAREFALQGLYQWQVGGSGPKAIVRDLEELEGHADADRDFLVRALEGVIADADALRPLIEPHADRPWDEVSPVERSILLLAAWELRHLADVPYRVTINEAIELAKRFGGVDGHKYVNGILDRLAERLRPDEVAESRKAKPRQTAPRAPRAGVPRKARA